VIPKTTKGKTTSWTRCVGKHSEEVREDSDKRTNIPRKLREKNHGEHTPCDDGLAI